MSEFISNANQVGTKRHVGRVPKRLILYFLILSGIIISYSMRTVLNLTILAMVKENNISEVIQNNSKSLCSSKNHTAIKPVDYGGTLEWSLNVQYYVLTAFFWSNTISHIFGAIAAHRYGGKIVVGVSLLIASVCCLCKPFASQIHYGLVISLQFIHGLAHGMVFPGFFSMVNWWIPLQEKSRYVSCFQGVAIGTALSQITSGYVIAIFGWKYAFYLPGVLGLLWCLMWSFLAYDKPELHSGISLTELTHIKENREQTLHKHNAKLPWRPIIFSSPLWAIIVAGFGKTWIQSTVTLYGPRYLKTVIGLEVQLNGLWSSLISIFTYVWALFVSYISDKLFIHKIIPNIVNRKLFAAIGMISSGVLCFLINFLNCNVYLTLIVWALIQTSFTTCFLFISANIVDIAPNLSGACVAFFEVSTFPGTILSTFVANVFLQDESSYDSWKNVFITAAAVLLATCIFYQMFASVDIQKWDKKCNVKAGGEESRMEELEVLKK